MEVEGYGNEYRNNNQYGGFYCCWNHKKNKPSHKSSPTEIDTGEEGEEVVTNKEKTGNKEK